MPVLARRPALLHARLSKTARTRSRARPTSGARSATSTHGSGGDFEADDADKLRRDARAAAHRRAPSRRRRRASRSSRATTRSCGCSTTMIVEAHEQGVSDIHIETQPGAREGARALPQGRRRCALPGAAARPTATRWSRASRSWRARHLRAPQAAGRQDQLRQVRAAASGSSCASRRSRPPTATRTSVMRLLASARPLPIDKMGFATRQPGARFKAAVERPYGMVPVRRPDRLGQDHDAALGARPHQHARSARSGPPRTRSRSRSRACARCRCSRRSTSPSPRRCAPFLRADPDVIMVGEMRDQRDGADRRSRRRSPATWCSRRCTPTARPRR